MNFVNPALWAGNQWLGFQRGAASLWSRAGSMPRPRMRACKMAAGHLAREFTFRQGVLMVFFILNVQANMFCSRIILQDLTPSAPGDARHHHSGLFWSCALFSLYRLSLGRLPLQGKLSSRSSAITQVKIDQRLVGDTDLLGKVLEVTYGNLVKTNRDLPLEHPCIRIPFRLWKIVFLSHDFHLSQYCSCSA